MSLVIILSIVATVLSILAIMKEILIPIMFRPNLLPTVGTTGEYKADLEDGGLALGTTVNYDFYRLKIENKASYFSSKADEVYVRILNIYKDKEELTPFNTMKTRWVAEASPSADLSKGEHLFVNLITVCHDERKEHYAYPGHLGARKLALPAGFPRDKLSKVGDFCYIIGMYGKNFKGKRYRVTFHFEPKDHDPISNLTREDITDKDGVSNCL